MELQAVFMDRDGTLGGSDRVGSFQGITADYALFDDLQTNGAEHYRRNQPILSEQSLRRVGLDRKLVNRAQSAVMLLPSVSRSPQ